MERRLCPICDKPGRFLPESSADGYVDYYRCEACGHVWHTPKDKPDGPISDVIVDILTDDS